MSSTFYLNVRRADVTNDWHDRVYAGFYRVAVSYTHLTLPTM